MPSQLRDLICSGKADGLRLSTGVAGSCESKEMTIASPPLVKQRRSRDPELTQNLILKAATDAFAMHGFEGATLPKIAASAGVSTPLLDRKSVVWGKSVSVRVDLGGRRLIKKKNNKQ